MPACPLGAGVAKRPRRAPAPASAVAGSATQPRRLARACASAVVERDLLTRVARQQRRLAGWHEPVRAVGAECRARRVAFEGAESLQRKKHSSQVGAFFLRLGLAGVTCGHLATESGPQVRFLAKRCFFAPFASATASGWPLPRKVSRITPWRKDHEPALGVAAAVRQPVPRLLLPHPPAVPAVVFVPVIAVMIGLGLDGGYRRSADSAARRGRPAALDADRVLAAPSAVSLGAEVPLRRQAPLHHPRGPPRPPQRPHAAGDASRAEHPAGAGIPGPVRARLRDPRRVSALRRSAGRLPHYDYTHYYLHHHTPKTRLGKRLREQHMRHHFQDHRYGFGVSSPLWDVVFRTLPRRRAG